MKIAVFGTGGVGGLLGGLLATHGHTVHFIARGKHLDALQTNGLQIQSTSGSFSLPKVLATSNPEEVGLMDLVLICVKTWQLAEVRDRLAPLVGKETLILPMENGVDTSEFLAEIFPRSQVMRGLCAMVSFVAAPGVIEHSGPDPFVAFGEYDNEITPRMQKLFIDLSVPGIRLKLPDDIVAAQWQKFLFIASMGVITSLVRLPVGIVRTVPQTRSLLESAMKEVVALAHTLQVKLPPDAVAKGFAIMDEMPEAGSTSMQRDFMAGRRTELEAFSGFISRKANELGIQTPIHQTCYDLLVPLELQAQVKYRSSH